MWEPLRSCHVPGAIDRFFLSLDLPSGGWLGGLGVGDDGLGGIYQKSPGHITNKTLGPSVSTGRSRCQTNLSRWTQSQTRACAVINGFINDWRLEASGRSSYRKLIVRGVEEGQQSRQKGHHLARSQTPNPAHAEDQRCQHPTGRCLFFSFSRLCSIAGPGLSSRQQGQPAARLCVTVHIWLCGELCVGTGESPERREK